MKPQERLQIIEIWKPLQSHCIANEKERLLHSLYIGVGGIYPRDKCLKR